MSTQQAPAITTARRWIMLALGVFAQTSSAMLVHGAAFLIPALRRQGLSLTEAGVLVGLPAAGLVLTLIAWGAVIDRTGERQVLVSGTGLVCAFITAAAFTHSVVALGACLFLAGAAAASTNGASGRVIVGWFPPHQRGLAMGIRQTAPPLGMALGALVIPPLAQAYGPALALLAPAALAGLACAGCAIWIINPPRPPVNKAAGEAILNPYRGDARLWRIHTVSALLVVPQVTAWTFALVWLTDRHGWSLAAAGVAVTLIQLLSALGRIGAGAWSDAVGSRLGPLRTIAVAAAAAMLALAFTDYFRWWIAIPIFVAATVISVADNGLAFTAVAEIAGPYWSGRGLGIQNTGQNIVAAAIPPLFGAVITAAGYPAAFLASAILAAAAVPLVPSRSAAARMAG